MPPGGADRALGRLVSNRVRHLEGIAVFLAALVGTLIGVPVGVLVGRRLWTAFASQIYAVPHPTVPALAIVYVAKSRVLKRLREEMLLLAEDVPSLNR